MALTLRPFQSELVEVARQCFKSGKKAPLLVAPTGAGKTVLFSYFTKATVEKGNQVMLLAHRAELIDQISSTLDQFQVPHSYISAGMPYDPSAKVHIGSVMSVVRRLGKVTAPKVIILDEAHHCAAGSWKKILEFYDSAWKLGVTATPCRLSGEPLGDIFDSLLMGPTTGDLVDQGYLSKYRIFAPSTINLEGVKTTAGDYNKKQLMERARVITGDAIKEYSKRANGKRAIVYCTVVRHAIEVAENFRAAGFASHHIDGAMGKPLRSLLIEEFKAGKIQVLTSVDIVSEGFDLPAIEVAIMLRPTQSLALWLQQAGRALRPYPGKEYAIILDHAGNAERHGLPCDERQWSLNGKHPKSKSPRKCPTCYGFQSDPLALICEFCGSPIKDQAGGVAKGGRGLVAEVEGELIEIDPAIARRKRLGEQSQAKTYEELVELGISRGYKSPKKWAEHLVQARRMKNAGNNFR